MSKCLRSSQPKLVIITEESSSNKKQKIGGRDQRAIMNKWWKEHRAANQKVLSEKLQLETEVIQPNQQTVNAELQLQQNSVELERLRSENERLKMQVASHEVVHHNMKEVNDRVMDELATTRALLLESNKGMPFLKKDSNRVSMLRRIADAILFVINIIMFKTRMVTRVHALKEVIFDNQLYGTFATERVMKEMTRAYSRKNIFVPWKVLRSIDLAINGGINSTGLEALRKVEDLQKYEQGCLPCRTTIQKCAAELYEVGQKTIPF
jgi:hypothetical protein